MFVIFEGPDGTGKSTQASLFAARLRGFFGDVVVSTREPTDGAYGSLIRASYKKENPDSDRMRQWFVNDRREHVQEVIQPALDRGEIVVCDRYYYSTAAYQEKPLDGWPMDRLLGHHKNMFPEPDLCFLFLTQDHEVIFDRLAARGEGDKFENRENWTRVLRNYERMLKESSFDCLVEIVDPLKEKEALADWIFKSFLGIRNLGLCPRSPKVDLL